MNLALGSVEPLSLCLSRATKARRERNSISWTSSLRSIPKVWTYSRKEEIEKISSVDQVLAVGACFRLQYHSHTNYTFTGDTDTTISSQLYKSTVICPTKKKHTRDMSEVLASRVLISLSFMLLAKQAFISGNSTALSTQPITHTHTEETNRQLNRQLLLPELT